MLRSVAFDDLELYLPLCRYRYFNGVLSYIGRRALLLLMGVYNHILRGRWREINDPIVLSDRFESESESGPPNGLQPC